MSNKSFFSKIINWWKSTNNKIEELKNMIILKVKKILIIFKDILIRKLNYKKLKYNSLNEFIFAFGLNYFINLTIYLLVKKLYDNK